ncbi:hypothetical protein EDF85_4071 [Pseudomonas putida]|uniref:Uncharacterized protein n=1 Tax=Pseudomonas putida TaxID=303 RepID=A0A9X8EJQ3_PSEPU|nr:hypothetical protein EDF85_4071 [Pseudomonas putida]
MQIVESRWCRLGGQKTMAHGGKLPKRCDFIQDSRRERPQARAGLNLTGATVITRVIGSNLC